MVNKCLSTRTKAQCEYGYQAEKNDQSPQGGRSVHHRCKRNAVLEEYQRKSLYPCQQVVYVLIY